MAEIIDLALVSNARRTLHKLLEKKGLNYFLKADAKRPFRLDHTRVEMVLRVAARKKTRAHQPHLIAVEHVRKEIRRELIRRVVAEMLQTGL